MIFFTFVHYNHEILLIKYAKPNQPTHFVLYNRVFVIITVIVITEFDCSNSFQWKLLFYQLLFHVFFCFDIDYSNKLNQKARPQKI